VLYIPKPPPMCSGAIIVPSLKRVGLDKETRQGRRGGWDWGVYGGRRIVE